MKPGDIILVAFPRTDLQAGKLRPALVLAMMPGGHPDVLLAMISSKTHQFIVGFDELISIEHEDFGRTRLKTTSVIRLSRLATVDRRIIAARLGAIGEDRLQRIYNHLIGWLQSISKV